MKQNYSFVEFDNEDDAEDCIKQMDGKSIEGKRMVVELTKQDNPRRDRERGGGGGGGGGGDRRNNLFCTKYPLYFKERDLEDLFDKFGPIKSIIMKANFSFIEFEDPQDADDCKRKMNGKSIEGKR